MIPFSKEESAEVEARIGLRRSAQAVLAVSLAVNLVLSIAVLSRRTDTRTILVPPRLSALAEFSSSSVPAAYLEDVSRYVARCALSATPADADEAVRAVLSLAAPAFYGTAEEIMRARARAIRSSHSSTAFAPASVTADTRNLTADVTGTLQTIIGTTVTSTRRVVLSLSWSWNGVKLQLESMKLAEKSR